MIRELRFVVPGRPVSGNDTYERRSLRYGGKGLRRSDAAQDYFARVQAAAVGALGHERCIFTKRVMIETTPHFTRDADAGAVSKLVQDALQGLAYQNDRVVLVAVPWKGEIDSQNPRTEVVVRELTEDETRVILEVPLSVAKPGATEKPRKRKRVGLAARLVSSARRYGSR
jgi:hypothetical protein